MELQQAKEKAMVGWETGNPALGGDEGEQGTFLPVEDTVTGLEGTAPEDLFVGVGRLMWTALVKSLALAQLV